VSRDLGRRKGIWAERSRHRHIVAFSDAREADLAPEKRTSDERHGIWAGGRGSGAREADIVTSSPSLAREKGISRQRSGPFYKVGFPRDDVAHR